MISVKRSVLAKTSVCKFWFNDFPSKQCLLAIVNRTTNEAYASLAISCLDVIFMVDSEIKRDLIEIIN